MAKEIDAYLAGYAQMACCDSNAKANLLAIGFGDATWQAIERASTGPQLRAAASDFALYLSSHVTVFDFDLAQPSGMREIDGFEILASLSMWKMAETMDVLANQALSVASLERATRYAMESVAAGNLALGMENSLQSIANEVNGIEVVAQQAANEVHTDVRARRSEIGVLGAEMRARGYEAHRVLVLKMAKECGHYKQSAAMIDISERLKMESDIILKPSTVKRYLCEAGWPRDFMPEKQVRLQKR